MAIQNSTKERTDTKVTMPKKYNVIMHNDDFTTMDFVVKILVTVFRKNMLEAEQIMLYVHQKGQAIVGSYSYDIALTKQTQAMEAAKMEGFPFRVTIEEA